MEAYREDKVGGDGCGGPSEDSHFSRSVVEASR